MNDEEGINTLDLKIGNIEDEIENVNQLCGQIENIMKQPRKSKDINQKPLSIVNTICSTITQTSEKNAIVNNNIKKHRGRSNISVDFNYESRKNKSPSIRFNSCQKNKLSSVEKKYAIAKKNLDKPKTGNNTSESNNVFNRLYKEAKNKKNNEEIKPGNSAKTKITPKIEDMLSRFKEFQIEKNNKLQEMKRKILVTEEELIKKVPVINNKSKKIVTTSDDFLTRMEKHKEHSELKKKELLEKEEAKRIEMEKKILDEMNRNLKKVDKHIIEDKISEMYEWDNNRKMKLNKLKDSELKKETEECTFKPGINKNSNRIATAKRNSMEPDHTPERLYKYDVINRKHKQEILKDIYAPSFIPILNTNYKNILTEVHDHYQPSERDKMLNGINVEYVTSKDNNGIEENLQDDKVKLFRNKNFDN